MGDPGKSLTNAREIANFAIELSLKSPDHVFQMTGLVFAGFGDHEIFPSMIERRSFGIVHDFHLYLQVESRAISHGTSAVLSAFAQTSMTETFRGGMAAEMFGHFIHSVSVGLAEFGQKLLAAHGVQDALEAQTSALERQTLEGIREAMFQRIISDHEEPLRRVLGSLPVGELAGLAETLINLESLKERVTKPSEEVGGPVDVAVITRGEGLVWIKRKHYFDATLNPHYQQRIAL